MQDVSEPPAENEYILRKGSNPPGWLIDIYASINDAGVVITRVDIRNDPEIDPLNGVTGTVFKSIKLPAFRAEVSDMIRRYAADYDAASIDPNLDPSLRRLLSKKADSLKAQAAQTTEPETRRTQVKKQRTWANQAQEAVAAAARATQQGVGLSHVLEELWLMSPDGVRSRIRRLRERKYIQGHGRSIQPGPALDAWRARQEEHNKE